MENTAGGDPAHGCMFGRGDSNPPLKRLMGLGIIPLSEDLLLRASYLCEAETTWLKPEYSNTCLNQFFYKPFVEG